MRLPDPMLVFSGPIPTGLYDGFRCLLCTHGGRFRARSRNGWNMTQLLPELAATLAPDVQLDGELVAWDHHGHPTLTGSADGCSTATPPSRSR